MDRKDWGHWQDWKPIALFAVFGVLIPAGVCRLLFGSWTIDSELEGTLAGVLSLAGLGVTIWVHNRW